MLKTKTTEIDGFKFHVTQLPGKKSLSTWYRVARAIGPSALQMSSVEGSADISALSGVLTELFMNMSESDFDSLCTDLLQGVQVQCPKSEIPEYSEELVELMEGQKYFDVVFAGRLLLLFSLLKFVLEVNYGDFIAALAGKA